MLLQQQKEMYLSLNFRWPVLMGSEGGDAPALPMSNSAFRTVGPTGSVPTGAHSSRGGPLPPISCLKDVAASLPIRPDVGPRVTRPTVRHPEALVPVAKAMPVRPVGASGGVPGSSGPSLPPGLTPSTSPPHHAFQVPSLLHPGHPHPPPQPPVAQGPAAAACHLSHLHNLLTADKALHGLPPYLHDPLAKAALLDFHGRLGQIPLSQYPLGKKLFGCPQCRYITDRKNNLKRHIATMHQECDKVLECCGVVFKNKASLRDHVLIFHSNGYMCRYCGRNFCRKALLKRHLTVHSGQKDFICGQCDYATSHKSNLERHKRVHDRQANGEEDLEDDDDEDEDVEVGEIRHGSHRMGLPLHHHMAYPGGVLHPADTTFNLHSTTSFLRDRQADSSREHFKRASTETNSSPVGYGTSQTSVTHSCSDTREKVTSSAEESSKSKEQEDCSDIDLEEDDDDDDEDPNSVVIDVVSLVTEPC